MGCPEKINAVNFSLRACAIREGRNADAFPVADDNSATLILSCMLGLLFNICENDMRDRARVAVLADGLIDMLLHGLSGKN
jgi:hypothetical protein